MRFAPPVSHVYNPLDYAWAPNAPTCSALGRAEAGGLRGHEPGPFGMVQTGVPFGEIAAVRDWMGIEAEIVAPPAEPQAPHRGLRLPRSEVSGRRLWGLFAERFGSAEAFFAEHFVANYCPLAFFDGGATSRPTSCRPPSRALLAACDAHLRRCRDPAAGVGDRRRGVGRAARPRGAGRLPLRSAGCSTQPGQPGGQSGLERGGDPQLVELGVW
jgi:single-strand selective monofunctional uracil DNA glycosylase